MGTVAVLSIAGSHFSLVHLFCNFRQGPTHCLWHVLHTVELLFHIWLMMAGGMLCCLCFCHGF